MRLSISNIAWDSPLDAHVAELLLQLGVTTIDVAPGKYFPDPIQASEKDIETVRQWWADRGITIYGMQSLLFGTTGLNVFGNADSQNAMLKHLKAVCRIAEGLGVKRLVFGSPRNRDRTGLTDEQAQCLALEFFNRLGAIATNHGVVIAIEPNPTCYGTNWITTTEDAFKFVTMLGNPGIAMQLDTGTVLINEEASSVVHKVSGAVGHVHISEPKLVPVGDNPLMHAPLVKPIQTLGVDVLTIEMVTQGATNTLKTIERSIKSIQTIYQLI